ncbi:MAG TPA: hypothetical protein VL284_20785 [Thermoanaerobaculia bacterium]|nr:hypothetical protein [Thermoanaerobaculia bacterium]
MTFLLILLLAAQRFDLDVREDFFTGLRGDRQAMQRAMKMCEERLAASPADAEALVWHGAGLYYSSGEAFKKGDAERGRTLQQDGLKEMDDAVARDGTIVTLIPRAAVLFSAARHIPQPDRARAALTKAMSDFEKVYSIQAPQFATLPAHSRGELLGALAEGWLRIGDRDRSKPYLERIVKELPGTAYAAQAKAALDNKGSEPPTLTCLTCHYD